jgi:hypothetical protein
MAKNRQNSDRPNFRDPMEIERNLVKEIGQTGKEQVRQRRKKGLSSFYAREGKIIEVHPNRTEEVRQSIKTKWITLDKKKRSVKL